MASQPNKLQELEAKVGHGVGTVRQIPSLLGNLSYNYKYIYH
jgi:hypothetical protein